MLYTTLGICIVLLIGWLLYRLCKWGWGSKIPEDLDTASVLEISYEPGTVTRLTEAKESGHTTHRFLYLAEFTGDNGFVEEIPLYPDGFAQLKEGQRQYLMRRGGACHALCDEPDRPDLEQIPVFFTDDFDEEIDREEPDAYEPLGLFGEEERRHSTPEEAQWEELLHESFPLPRMTYQGQCEAETVHNFPPHHLLSLCKIPPFLRRMRWMQEQFCDAYKLALQTLIVNEGNGDSGQHREKAYYQGNNFQVEARIQKQGDGGYQIFAECVINGEEE